MSQPLAQLARRATELCRRCTAPTTAAAEVRALTLVGSYSSALVALLPLGTGGTQSAEVAECALKCVCAFRDRLVALPEPETLNKEVAAYALRVMRHGGGVLSEEDRLELLHQVDARVEGMQLQLWTPTLLLHALHSIAKSCPKAYADPSLHLLDDILICLGHQLAQLKERDVALLLWCLATLERVDGDLWAATCRRCKLLLPQMNGISRATVMQAVLLPPTCTTTAHLELMHEVRTTQLSYVEGNAGRRASRTRRSPRQRSRSLASPLAGVEAVEDDGNDDGSTDSTLLFPEGDEDDELPEVLTDAAALADVEDPYERVKLQLIATAHSLRTELLVSLCERLWANRAAMIASSTVSLSAPSQELQWTAEPALTSSVDAKRTVLSVKDNTSQPEQRAPLSPLSVLDQSEDLVLVLEHLSRRQLGFEDSMRLLQLFRAHGLFGDGGIFFDHREPSEEEGSSGDSRVGCLLRITQHAVASIANAPLGSVQRPEDVLHVLVDIGTHVRHAQSLSQHGGSSSSASPSTQQRKGRGSVRHATVSDGRVDSLVASMPLLAACQRYAEECLRRQRGRLQTMTGTTVWTLMRCVQLLRDTVRSDPAVSTLFDAVSATAGQLPTEWGTVAQAAEQCAAVVVHAANSNESPSTRSNPSATGDEAYRLLDRCVTTLRDGGLVYLSTSRLLRLLSAVEEPHVVGWWATALAPLSPYVLEQLDCRPDRRGLLREMTLFLSQHSEWARISVAGRRFRWGVKVKGDGSGNSGNTSTTGERLPLPDVLLDLYVRLLLTERGEWPLSSAQVRALLACFETREGNLAALERAFVILLTRRLGMETAFLNVVRLPAEALAVLIEYAYRLYAARTGTSTSILVTLFRQLTAQVQQCGTIQSVNDVAALLAMPVCEELQVKEQVAHAVQTRAVELLTQSTVPAVEKAYLVAFLVRANAAVDDALLTALQQIAA